jgi:Holliday junction resolvasome RuvABC endonuclease subunit
MERTKTTKKECVILANDPSFTAWGWAAVTPDGRILETGCIKTESKSKKLRIRKGDDRVRRTSEICLELLRAIHEYDVDLIVSELPHGSQNASAAVMIGIVIGILQTIAETENIAIEWYSEADAKQCLLGKQSATKKEMIDVITKLYEVPWTGIGYKDEAVADCLAVFHVAREQSSMIRMMRKLGKEKE